MKPEPHTVQLCLRRGEHDEPAVTIDGFPLRHVTDVQVSSPARGPTIVTVSFAAEATTPPAEGGDEPELQAADNPRPVTNGG